MFRELPIWPPLLLAPMAGVTHSALRTTILTFGGIGLLSTEMLAAWRLPKENPAVSPFLIRTPAEKPLSYQLLVSQPETLGPALDALHRLSANAVDINLGCPAPRIQRAGGGARLAADSDMVRRILREARKETTLPISAKIRLGKNLDAQRMIDFSQMLEDEGVDLLTVHARLEKEAFCRKPRWEWVAKIKEAIAIPVIANGGIWTVDDARQCLAESRADGLMIGRAAATKPWLFAEIAAEIYKMKGGGHPMVSLPRVYYDFSEALQKRFRPERRLGRLKEFTHYFAANYAFGHHLASRVQSSQTMEEALSRAGDFFSRSDAEGLKKLQQDVADAFKIAAAG